MATVTTATGYLAFSREISADLWAPLAGTLLLAAAASATNHLQDQRFDALMTRTMSRPLPSGEVDRGAAALLAIALAGMGLAALASAAEQPLVVLGLGALAMAWYNGVYTYLKRVTPFAVVPGSVIGALPPLIGWVAAGGSLADSTAWLLASFFFVWQVPHFWLLALRHDADYRRSGWPVLTDVFTPAQIARIIFVWILATVVTGLMAGVLARLPLWAYLLLLGGSIWLAWGSRHLHRQEASRQELGAAFGRINLYALLFCAAISLGALVG